MKAIVNGKIICENNILVDHVVLFDRKIKAILSMSEFQAETCEKIIDANGAWVSPGFINEHIHGCLGFDVMDETEDALYSIRQSMVKTGVTSFLPTTMTYDLPKIGRAMEKIRTAMQEESGASVLGCHMEGPFISEKYKGAQAATHIIPPDFSFVEQYADVIKIVTIAPETLPDFSFIKKCKECQIVVSLGHSGATYEETKAAIRAGASHITHMFNGLPVFNHREPGVIGAAMDSRVNCELIIDNIHIHPAMQRILVDIKGVEKVILITDSMRACMLPDGDYELGGQPVIVKNQTARLESGVIAGSVLTMNQAVKNFKINTGLTWPEVIRTVSVNPAKACGVFEKKGSIAVGKDADFTMFNEDVEIAATFVHGKIQYRR